MSLIAIDKNILINPDRIDAIESITLRGKRILNIYIGGKKFVAGVSIEDLMKQLKQGIDLTSQFFAG